MGGRRKNVQGEGRRTPRKEATVHERGGMAGGRRTAMCVYTSGIGVCSVRMDLFVKGSRGSTNRFLCFDVVFLSSSMMLCIFLMSFGSSRGTKECLSLYVVGNSR